MVSIPINLLPLDQASLRLLFGWFFVKMRSGTMPGSVITLAELETICCQAAATWPISPADYRPTAKQIYFFTLVWLLKRKVIFQQAEDCLDNQTAASSDRAYQVAYHLDEWGGTVARLKQREAKEWELLRIQMEKAIRYYYSQPEGMQADALQEALLKIFRCSTR